MSDVTDTDREKAIAWAEAWYDRTAGPSETWALADFFDALIEDLGWRPGGAPERFNESPENLNADRRDSSSVAGGAPVEVSDADRERPGIEYATDWLTKHGFESAARALVKDWWGFEYDGDEAPNDSATSAPVAPTREALARMLAAIDKQNGHSTLDWDDTHYPERWRTEYFQIADGLFASGLLGERRDDEESEWDAAVARFMAGRVLPGERREDVQAEALEALLRDGEGQHWIPTQLRNRADKLRKAAQS